MIAFGWRRWTSALAGFASGLAGLGGAAAAHPQSVAASEAPVEWVQYAEAATQSITSWLEEESEPAAAFRAHLHQTRPAQDQPTPALTLKVWMGPEGRVDRVDFVPFADEPTNANLRALIIGRDLPPPPRAMLLPLRLSIQLEAGQATPEGDARKDRLVVAAQAGVTLH